MQNTQAINVTAGNATATGSVTVSDNMPGVPCPDPAGYKYVGARYVPLFSDPLEWNSNTSYEPLTIVLYQGNSYTSRQYVPVGIQIDNTEFWALTGNYNAQVEQYRQEVAANSAEVNALKSSMTYHVGENQDYTTITSAVTAANKNGGICKIVIEPGVYDESINLYNYTNVEEFSFIGRVYGSVVWQSARIYGYKHPCLNVSGNVNCQNIIFVKGNETLTGSGTGGYAVHNDDEYTGHSAVYRNCKFVSYENAAFGSGTRSNNSITMIDCECVSYKENNQNGAFLYHSGPAGSVNEELTLIRNYFHGEGDGCYGCSIYKAVGSEGVGSRYVFIENVIFGKQVSADVAGISYFSPSDNSTTWASSANTWFGNSLSNMNYSNGAYTGELGYGKYLDTHRISKGKGVHSSVLTYNGNEIGTFRRINSDYFTIEYYNPVSGRSYMNINGTVRPSLGNTPMKTINYFNAPFYIFGNLCIFSISVVVESGNLKEDIVPANDVTFYGDSGSDKCALTLKADGTFTCTKAGAYNVNGVYILKDA